jgi:hypothetical protein
MKHLTESELALYTNKDLPAWEWPMARVHLSQCELCRNRAESYGQDRANVRAMAGALPEGLDWDRLAAEMTANIRVGLAAGECVAPRGRRTSISLGWRMAAVVGGFTALLISGWWLNMPPSQSASLARAAKSISDVRHWSLPALRTENSGPLVEAAGSGIELRENGAVLGVLQRGSRPVSVTLSVQGSARARYVDSDTGQVTITSVYAQ